MTAPTLDPDPGHPTGGTSQDIADTAVTPALLLDRVRAARRTADAAEVELLQLAVEWAHAHPARPGRDESWTVPGSPAPPGTLGSEDDPDADVPGDELAGIPAVRWDAPAAFAAANHLTTDAGQALIRDALTLHHRLPLTWARTLAGHVTAWRARRIAQAVLGRPDDVATYVDQHVAPVAGSIGAIRLDRLVDEAMLRLYAEERELAQLAALDARYVRLDERTLNHTGIAEMTIRAEWRDLHDLDHTLSNLARKLGQEGSAGHGETLDVRRAMAIGVLADPAAAAALLTGAEPPSGRPSHRTVLHVHLTEPALWGLDPVGRNATTGRPELEQTIRSWCGRTDTHLTVQPVLDLTEHLHTDQYEVPDRLRAQVAGREPTCVFPWCHRPAAACDCDHIEPHAQGGATCTHNLAPLCRRHHRLKTHARWRYRPLDPITDPGTHLWTDPHGRQYLRGPTGTIEVSPAGLPTHEPD